VTDAAQDTYRLMYRSRNRIPEPDRKVELGELFLRARRNNKRSGVTGALLLTGDWFVQVLEGEERAVRAVYDRIRTDPRHDEVTLLESGDAGERVFGRWSMARVSDDGGPDVPLIAHEDGIAEAAGRRPGPAEYRLLAAMRAAAGAAAV
jgi:hypothetical protein